MLTLPRDTYRFRSMADEQVALGMRLRELGQARVNYGYRRLHVPLQPGGLGGQSQGDLSAVSPGGLAAKYQETQGAWSCQRRMEWPVAAGIDESWSIDFMIDELFDLCREPAL